MNDLTGKYFAKKAINDEYQDLTTLFDGLRILKIDGFMSEGQPKNVYTASWEYDDDEDFAIVMQDDEDTIKIIRECVDLDITFIIKGSYASETIDVNTQHLRFKNYMLGKDVWIKSMYQDELEAHCVCLKEYKPTTEKYHRGIDSYVMGTITMHMLEKPTNTKMRPIVFQDPVVKQLCVENWGNQFIEGEITEWEAAQVKSIAADKNGNEIASGAGPFYNNKNISYFNEFRYFTGITGNGIYWKNTGNTVQTYRGRFANCSLKEITIPASPIVCLAGVFYYCRQIEEIDMSRMTFTGTSEGNRRISVAFSGCTAVKRIIFPPQSFIVDNLNQAFGGSSSSALSNLEYLDLKNLDFKNTPTSSTIMFRYCPKLKDLPSGIPNLGHTQNLRYNPLTHDSAVAVIENLMEVATTQTITFSATTYATLTEDDISIATEKGWAIASA